MAFNPWSHYDIPHLSPSACNRFLSSPAMYLQEYVFKKRGGVGAAAHRGTAAEAGIAAGLSRNASLEECQDIALTEFDRLTALLADPRRDKERTGVPKIVEQGLKELKPYGVPTGMQGEMLHKVEGLLVPIKGFYDFLWEDKGILVDLKTTLALPSKISGAHARQVAFYNIALSDNLDARISYVTPAKAATYQLENAREHYNSLVKCALTIQRFLSLSEDKQELASLVLPDTEGFFLSDPRSRQAAFEIWGI